MKPEASHNSLSRYLEEITGEPLYIRGLPDHQQARVPLYIRSFYDLAVATLFAREFVLAIQIDREERPTPSEYHRHAETLAKLTGYDAVLVLPKLLSYTRNRLVHQGVPFVVPHQQLFLPTLLIDLHERYPRKPKSKKARLSPTSQVVLISHLMGQQIEGIALKQLAASLGYSSMTMSNARDDLESAGLCEVVTFGRSRHLKFRFSKRDLWEKAKLSLQSPIRAKHWVHLSELATPMIKAGLSALSDLTQITDNPMPTIAVYEREYRSCLETGVIRGCPGQYDASARLEAWKYDPKLLSIGPTVDPYSLYLSLKDSDEDRVQIALEQLMGEMQW